MLFDLNHHVSISGNIINVRRFSHLDIIRNGLL